MRHWMKERADDCYVSKIVIEAIRNLGDMVLRLSGEISHAWRACEHFAALVRRVSQGRQDKFENTYLIPVLQAIETLQLI